MPPSPKFTRAQIAEAALSVIREKGLQSLSAREVARALGSSTRPIFTVFKDMADLSNEVRRLAVQEFERYLAEAHDYYPTLAQAGVQVMRYAINEPNVFLLVAIPESKENIDYIDLYTQGVGSPHSIKAYLKDNYELSEDEADAIFHQLSACIFGLAVAAASNTYRYTEEDAFRMLHFTFHSALDYVRGGRLNEPVAMPTKKGDGSP